MSELLKFNLAEVVAAVAGAAALLGIVVQLRSEGRINKARFILEINTYLADYADVRSLLRAKSAKEIEEMRSSPAFERVLDYFTAFENIYTLKVENLLSLADIGEYFGGRFVQIMNSQYVLSKNSDTAFIKTFNPLYRLKDALERNGSYG